MPGEPFVGRRPELAAAAEAWERAVSGERQTLLLLGEPGIGKTWLAARVAKAAVSDGAAATWGRAWESGGAPPLWPWTQILRELRELPESAAVRSEFGDGAELLEQATRTRHEVEGFAGAEPDARFVLFETVAAFLTRVSMRRPLVLVLDDVHAADLSTLHLLHFIARLREPARLLVLATARTAELGRTEGVASVLSAIGREGEALTLAGLTSAEVTELVQALDPRVVDDATNIDVLTGGNPFFVTEVARARRAHGWRVTGEQRADRTPLTPIVSEAIRSRVRGLPAESQQLLAAASVLGRLTSVDLLGHLLGQPLVDVEAAATPALAEGLLTSWGLSNRVLQFSHELVRLAIYEELPAQLREHLHEAAGLRLSTQATHPSEQADLIAHHFTRAGPSRRAEAIDWLTQSGEVALQQFAYDAAEERFLAAVQLADGGADDELCDLLISLGTAQLLAGKPDGPGALLRAAALARQMGDGNRLARALITFVGSTGGNPYVRNEEWIERVEDALTNLPPAELALRARLLGSLLVLLWEPQDAERRAVALSEALELAEASGDDIARGEVLNSAAASMYFRRSEEQRRYVEALAEVASRLRASDSASVGLRGRELTLQADRYRTTFALEDGDISAFDRAAARVMEAAEQLPRPLLVVVSGCLHCVRDQMAGRMREIEARAATFPDLLPNDLFATVAYWVELGWSLYEQNRLGEIREQLEELSAGMPRLVGLRLFLALEAMERERPAEARGAVAPVLAQLDELPRDASWLSFLCGLVLVARELGEEAWAAKLYSLLEPSAGQHVVVSFRHAGAYLGSVELYLGIAGLARGEIDRAAAHLERSLSEHRQVGAAAWAAVSAHELASALWVSGSEPERAKQLAEQARVDLMGTSMTRAQGQVGALLQEIDASAAKREIRFLREGDVWCIRYQHSESRIRSVRGLEYLAVLTASPGTEIHATDLLRGEAPTSNRQRRRRSTADADVVLDEQAISSYRTRIAELEDEMATAAAHHDSENQSRRRSELDFLLEELGRTTGLGGRGRSFTDEDEKARVAVTKAIRRAITAIGGADEKLGRHLDEAVSTGTFCVYRP